METRTPNIEYHGPAATHDQSCAVILGAPAVLDMSMGVFQPSWEAQKRGWRLVCAMNPLQRLAIRMLWSKP